MSDNQAQFDHWVTIDDHHVLIKDGSDNEPSPLHHLNESGLHQKLMSGEAKPRQGDFVAATLGTFAGFVKSEKTVAVGKKGSITGNMVAGPHGHEVFLPHSQMKFVAPREYDTGVKFSPDFAHPNPKKARSTFATGDEVENLQLATFDLNGDFTETDDFVIVRGKIFEAGEYADKNFTISPDELAEVAATFKPVPVDYSHVEGPLDGKLGELSSVSLAENGTDLLGEVKIPKWLDRALGDTARKVSCTWNRATKQLEKLALVNNPRISDAVLYSHFIDDQLEKFRANEEAEFEGKRNSATDHKTIQAIHDSCMSLGARCSGENADFSSDTNTNQDNKELPQMSEETKVEFKDSPEYQAMIARFDAQNAEIERMKAEKRHNDAVATVEALLREGKAVPAERLALVAAFELAATDDASNPVKVTFGEGAEGSRVDALKAVYAARPAHVLFGEQVPVGSSVLYTQETVDPNKVSQDRVRELLAQSPLGQSVLESGK